MVSPRLLGVFLCVAIVSAETSFAQQAVQPEVYLDDLQERASDISYGSLGKHGASGFPDHDVQRLRLKSGKELLHGLSIVPRPMSMEGISHVVYDLKGQYASFQGTAAINFPVPDDGLQFAVGAGWKGESESTVRFRVIGDGQSLWESKPLRKSGDAEDCHVSVAGVDELKLEVVCTGSERFAWSFWANPRLTLAGEASMPANVVINGTDSDADVVFRELTLPYPVTSFDMTEDGQFLVLSHQSAGVVSIYSVLTGEVVQEIKCPSPRSVLCRGDSAFVANYGHGTISDISRGRGWRVKQKYRIVKPYIVDLTAPALPNFKNELLVTCHGNDRSSSYQDCHTFRLDTRSGRSIELARCSSVSVSADGEYVYEQASFNLSSSGAVSVYPYREFIVSGNQGDPLFRSGEKTPYIYQVPQTRYVLSDEMVLSGSSLEVRRPFSGIVVPDLAQELFYSVDADAIHAHRFNTSFKELAWRRVVYPKTIENFSVLEDHRERKKDYYLDHPLAYTHSDRLHLFVLAGKGGKLLAAETTAFENVQPAQLAGDNSSKDTAPVVATVPPSDPSKSPMAGQLDDAATAAGRIGDDSMSDVIERCERSVVRIEVQATAGGGSLGSGFVVAPGLIATNVHVLAGAESATAIFPNQQEYAIVGTLFVDAERDIAIARISGSNLESIPSLAFAEGLPRKGQRVVALGSPLGLSFTATSGVVSAIRTAEELIRELNESDLAGVWIQVDASLSPGNSGGPLINDRGEVVGMSTLASRGAQNLNFGIAASEIREAIEAAHGKQPVPLADEQVLVEMRKSVRDDDTRGGTEIPMLPVVDYVTRGIDEFSELQRNLKADMSRIRELASEIRRGESYIPSQLDKRKSDIVRVKIPGRRTHKWFFRSEAIKKAQSENVAEYLDDLNSLYSRMKNPDDPDALLALLWKYGPSVEPRDLGSVGFLSDCLVIRSYNEHEVLISKDETPYLIYLDTTVGLWSGQELRAVPVFVSGVSVAEVEGGSSMSLTVLVALSRDQLEEAVKLKLAELSKVAGSKPKFESRTWSDTTGKFSIEAVLIELTPTEAVLRKSDGTSIRVPRSRLSRADQEYLTQAQ